MSEPRITFRTPWLDRDDPRPHAMASPDKPGVRGPVDPPTPPETADVAAAAAAAAAVALTKTPAWVNVAVFACGVLGVVGLVLGPVSGNANITGALITTPVLFGITLAIARRLAKADNRPVVVPILIGAFCLKVLGSALRYYIATSVYSTGDFFDYNKWGVRVANGLRHGEVIELPGRFAGTNFTRFITGVIYTVSPAQLFSGFVIYGWLSFIGLLFFWRAYRLAISPERDLTYLKWIVLLPSLLYWPSSVGKDSIMVLAMGVTSYGAACLLSHRITRGVPAIAGGLTVMCMVRPHIALVACGGLALAALFRQNRGGLGARLLTVAIVLVAAVLVIQVTSSFFGFNTFDRSSISQQITETSKQTGDGGSQFSPVIVDSPIKFPLAAFTVLYRPSPLEAGSFQEWLTAIENVFLVVMSLIVFRRAWYAIRRSREYPYFLFCIGALLVFIVAFSGFSNFGLLARQRAVIQPLLLVFLSLPKNMEQFLPARFARQEPARPLVP